MFDSVVGFPSGVGKLLQLPAVAEPDGKGHQVEAQMKMVRYIRTVTKCRYEYSRRGMVETDRR